MPPSRRIVHRSEKPSIPDLLPSWVRSLRASNRADKTIKAYTEAAQQLAAFLDSRGRPASVTSISRADVEAFITHLLETRSASTAATRYRGLQQLFNWLVEEEEIPTSPMERMRPPKQVERVVPVVEDEYLAQLFKVCDKSGFENRRDYALFALLLTTGLRRAEASGMQLGDVHLDRAYVRVMGKGRRERHVPLTAKVVRALDRYERVRARHGNADLEAYWLGAKGPLTDSGMAQILARRCDEARIPRFTLHQFRHTFTSAMLAAGAQEGEVMRLTGWSSPQMLERYGRATAAARARDTHRRISPGDRFL